MCDWPWLGIIGCATPNSGITIIAIYMIATPTFTCNDEFNFMMIQVWVKNLGVVYFCYELHIQTNLVSLPKNLSQA